MECLAALGRLYLGWGRHREAHSSHLAALKAAERLGTRHAVVRRLVAEMAALREVAEDYLGKGELDSRLRVLQNSADERPR